MTATRNLSLAACPASTKGPLANARQHAADRGRRTFEKATS